MCQSPAFIFILAISEIGASFEINLHLNLGMHNVMDSTKCAKVLRALGDDTRLKILDFLFSGEYSVSDISEGVGVEYSQVSHHLSVLRNAGLVSDSKDGKFVMYKLHPVFYDENSDRKNVLDFECCSIEFNNKGIYKR